MSAIESALPRVEREEGFRARAYRDTRGRLTIGYGFCVDAGISEYAASALCSAQLTEIAHSLGSYWWAQGLDDARMGVILDIAYNLGVAGLLHFVEMLSCVGKQDWVGARAALLDSDAARELPTRYGDLAQILLSGVA